MTALQLTPVILSLVVLGAHFLRSGPRILTLALLALAILCSLRRAWVARTIQVVLGLGTLVWIGTAVDIAGTRMRQGEPWTRMAVIIGSVAAISALSALVLQTRGMRGWFGHGGGARADGPPAGTAGKAPDDPAAPAGPAPGEAASPSREGT